MVSTSRHSYWSVQLDTTNGQYILLHLHCVSGHLIQQHYLEKNRGEGHVNPYQWMQTNLANQALGGGLSRRLGGYSQWKATRGQHLTTKGLIILVQQHWSHLIDRPPTPR